MTTHFTINPYDYSLPIGCIYGGRYNKKILYIDKSDPAKIDNNPRDRLRIVGEIITDGKLLKIARIIVAVIALIYLIGLLTGYVGTPHTLLIK